MKRVKDPSSECKTRLVCICSAEESKPEAVVSTEEGIKLAQALNCVYVELCTKNMSIGDVISNMTDEALPKYYRYPLSVR